MTRYFYRIELIKSQSDADALLTSMADEGEWAEEDWALIAAGNISEGHLLYLSMSKEGHDKLQDKQARQDADVVAFETKRLEEDEKEVVALLEGMDLDWKTRDDLDAFVAKLKPLTGSRMAEAIERLKEKAKE